MKQYYQAFAEKFGQSWSACMLCMVQGDLSVVNMGHAITASKTGALTGIVYCISLLVDDFPKGRWFPVWLTGVLTMCADIVVHPTHFGNQWVEAACTGAAAAFLCFMWERR